MIATRVNEPVKALLTGESEKIDADLDYFNCYDGLWHVRLKNVQFRGRSLISTSEKRELCILASEKVKRRKMKGSV